MNKIKGFKIFAACILALLFSCNDLNVPPWDKTSDEDVFSTENGIRAYMARLYADMPIVQFVGGELVGGTGYRFTGEFIGGIEAPAPEASDFDKWSHTDGKSWDYPVTRQQCYFLQTLPKYAGNFTAEKVNTWTAEVHFLRAYRYFEMVKRYGGVPIVKRVLNYPAESLDELTLPRDKEKDCYDFILEDIDEAIKYFEQGISEYRIKGRANVHVARALKARVALHAASLAKYGSQEPQRYVNFKNGLTGIAASEAKRYYDIAWRAAKDVIDKGGYGLYSAKTDKVENYINIFLDQNSNETIFARYYDGTSLATLYDFNNCALQYGASAGYKSSPTLEFIKMFDNIEGGSYADPAVLKTGTDAAPELYDSPLDLFAKVEPRLRAIVLLPGETDFKKATEAGGDDNVVTEVRYGILTKGNAPTEANLKSTDQNVLMKGGDLQTTPYEADGKTMRAIGKSGMSSNLSTVTGFHLRKWMDPSLNSTTMFQGSKVPWTEMRYAEVLLIAAEAAVELKELGDASHMSDAATYINRIRERAGAFNRNYSASSLTKDVVRLERRKELFLENKTYWDLIRWRTIDDELNNRYWSGLRPIYVWDEAKYYMQPFVVNEGLSAGATFNTRNYYSEIPSDERNKNKRLESNHD